MSENTILDLDAMLDVSMADVPDVPDFQNPPDGVYNLTVHECKADKRKGKDGKPDTPIIKVMYKVVNTLELAKASEIPVADGTMFSENFTISEDGLKFFKKTAGNILNIKDFEGATLRDIIQGLAGAEFKAVLKTRVSTSNGKEYENVGVRPVHEATA